MAEAARWMCSSCSNGRHFCDLINLDMTRACVCERCAGLSGTRPEPDDGRCSSDGGTGIGAGHVCRCTRPAGHPLDGRAAGSDHGCPCGAHWNTDG